MTRFAPQSDVRRPARLLALGAALVLLAGCGGLLSRTPPPRYGMQRLYYETARVLDVDEPDPAFYRQRARLQVMGRELDGVLIELITDPSVKESVRANAVTLLADRGGFNAVGVLRRLLVTSNEEPVRAAAVVGLQRFAADSPGVRNALRAAISDPSARVRLGALQGLDVEDAPAIRAMLPKEDDGRVRVVARQLLTLFEARGAALARDERGDLRTAGDDTVPRIVFHPVTSDTAGGVSVGALWVELPEGKGLVPLAQEVEVVDGVVPAFFDATRRSVVFEADRRIHIRDLLSGETREVSAGVAPRLMPFTDGFVYLREVPGSRREVQGATEVDYAVMRAAFAGGPPETVGRLSAVIRADRHHGASPVRTVVVGEARDGFVLRGTDLTGFVLPGPLEGAPQRQ
ncbi:MAG TPA: HEAT repeat domain-containing protein [Longimicrobiaceae bacterium]|nr:HEAT repeat domain-containing protein [Longimicrobiaceae bacterium]